VARYGRPAGPECPDSGAGQWFGKPGTDVSRVGGADANGNGVGPVPGPERTGHAFAASCDLDRASARLSDTEAGNTTDPTTDTTPDDSHHACDPASRHRDADAGSNPRTHTGTNPRTHTGTNPRADPAVDVLTLSRERPPIGTCYTSAAVSGRP
jgi:hypothetical protein